MQPRVHFCISATSKQVLHMMYSTFPSHFLCCIAHTAQHLGQLVQTHSLCHCYIACLNNLGILVMLSKVLYQSANDTHRIAGLLVILDNLLQSLYSYSVTFAYRCWALSAPASSAEIAKHPQMLPEASQCAVVADVAGRLLHPTSSLHIACIGM